MDDRTGQSNEAIVFRDEQTHHLRDGSHRWIAIKSFERRTSQPNRECLASVMEHERYRDHYAGPQEDWSPTDNIHGPYKLDLLSVDCFDSVAADQTLDQLTTWTREYEQAGTPDLLAAEASVRDILNGCESIFLLQNLRTTAQHDWGGVLDDFREYVAISPGAVHLIVASGD